MRIPLLLCSLLILQGCNKSEEKPQPVRDVPPGPEHARKPPPPPVDPSLTGTSSETPAQPAPAETPPPPPPLPPPSQTELDAYYYAVDALVEEATKMLDAGGGALPEDQRAPMRVRAIEVLKTRAQYTRSLTGDPLKNLNERLAPFMKISKTLAAAPMPVIPRPPARPPAEGQPPAADTPAEPAPAPRPPQ